ncbi:MAG: hypothetical protein ABH840_00590 [Nanoarchaeota archaeon]
MTQTQTQADLENRVVIPVIPIRKLRKVPEGYVQCVKHDCRQLVPKEQAQNYGFGNVCPPCYKKWWESED